MPFNLSDKRILLADDSTIMRMVISMHLKRFTGASITEAANGQEALVRLTQEKFDLLLTDLNMPEMNGIELVRHIREGLKSDIPIVIITTKGEVKDRELGLSLGANSYITKPLNVKEVVMAVVNHLEKKRLRPGPPES